MKQVIDYVPGTKYKIFQDREFFSFGTDSLLITGYFKLKGKVLDLGTGNGIIPIRLYDSSRITSIIGYEIQEEVYKLGQKSVNYNNLTDKITLHLDDINNIIKLYNPSSFNSVITNPPYFKNSLKNTEENKSISRHTSSFENWIEIGSKMLVPQGYFYTMNRPSNLAEVVYLMKKFKIEPKQLCFVKNSIGDEPFLFLISGRKNGNTGIKVDKDLVLYDGEDRSETFKKLYNLEY